jgi:hypothetical protein
MFLLSSLGGIASWLLGANHHLNQQITKMQTHHQNKREILRSLFYSKSRYRIVKRIFEDYEDVIQVEKYCYVKYKGRVYCVESDKAPSNDIYRFNGLFPPSIVMLELMESVDNLPNKTYMNYIKYKAKEVYAGKNLFENLESWNLQLDTILESSQQVGLKC